MPQSRAAVIPASDCCRPLLSLWYKAAVVLQHSVCPCYLTLSCCSLLDSTVAAVAWGLQWSLFRGLQEQNKSQDLKLSNESTLAFPFIPISSPGDVPCQCKEELTYWSSVQTDRVMPSDVPLLASETVTSVGVTKFLSLVTLSRHNSYVKWREPWWEAVSKEKQEKKSWESWILRQLLSMINTNISKSAITEALQSTSASSRQFLPRYVNLSIRLCLKYIESGREGLSLSDCAAQIVCAISFMQKSKNISFKSQDFQGSCDSDM